MNTAVTYTCPVVSERGAVPVLVVDADTAFIQSLAEIAEPYGFHIDSVSSGDTIVNAFREQEYSVILIDAAGVRTDSDAVIAHIRKLKPDVQIILIAGWNAGIQMTSEMSERADDFIRKPFDPERLIITLQNAAARSCLYLDRACLLETIKENSSLIGISRAVRHISSLVDKAGLPGTSVLLQGEPGTGKELAARLIHLKSTRAARPFITIDLSDIQGRNLEQELFGCITNTGIVQKSRVSTLKGGTLFLREIGNLPLIVQTKLLNLIENGYVETEGGNKFFNKNIRVISSTANDLKHAAINGTFRQDLLYRINVITITTAPLRERSCDIPLLANHFAEEMAKAFRKNNITFAPEAMQVLQNYSWPGNVRELKNLCAHLTLLHSGKVITPDELSASCGSGTG